MAFPTDPKSQELIKAYLIEAKGHDADKALAESRLQEVFDAIEESQDRTGFTKAEFKEALAAWKAYDKTQLIVDKKTAALEVIDLLKI